MKLSSRWDSLISEIALHALNHVIWESFRVTAYQFWKECCTRFLLMLSQYHLRTPVSFMYACMYHLCTHVSFTGMYTCMYHLCTHVQLYTWLLTGDHKFLCKNVATKFRWFISSLKFFHTEFYVENESNSSFPMWVKEYLVYARSISYLLMPWLLMSPGHQVMILPT